MRVKPAATVKKYLTVAGKAAGKSAGPWITKPGHDHHLLLPGQSMQEFWVGRRNISNLIEKVFTFLVN